MEQSGGSFVRSPNGSFVKMNDPRSLSGEAAKGAKWSGSSGSSDRSPRGLQGSWGGSSRDPAPLANQFRGEGHHQFVVGCGSGSAGAAGGGGGGYVIGLKACCAVLPPPPPRLSTPSPVRALPVAPPASNTQRCGRATLPPPLPPPSPAHKTQRTCSETWRCSWTTLSRPPTNESHSPLSLLLDPTKTRAPPRPRPGPVSMVPEFGPL